MLTTANNLKHTATNIASAMLGIGVPNTEAAKSRSAKLAAFSLPSAPFNGRAWRGVARLACASTGTPTRQVPSTIIGVMVTGIHTLFGGITMSNNTKLPIRFTKKHPFFSCNFNNQSLFTVRKDIEIDDALSQASCFLASALKISEELAIEQNSEVAWAANYLIEISKALIDSASHQYEIEGQNHGI